MWTEVKSTLHHPARFIWILLSLLLAYVVYLMPLSNLWMMPNVLLLVLIFWILSEPTYVGLGLSFGVGMMIDLVHTGMPLGRFALAYVIVAELCRLLSRRIFLSNIFQQPVYILVMALACQGVVWLSTWIFQDGFPSGDLFINAVMTAVSWPLVSWLVSGRLYKQGTAVK